MTTSSQPIRRKAGGAKRVPTAPAPAQQEDKPESLLSRLAIPIVIVVAILVMLSIPVYGWIQSTVIPGQQPLAIINGQTITMDTLVRRLRYERALFDARQAKPEEFASVPMQAVFDLVDNEIIRQGAVAANALPSAGDIADEKVAIARNGLSGEAWADVATQNATRKSFERNLWASLPSRADQVKLTGFTLYTQREAEDAMARIRAGEPIDRVAAELGTTQQVKDRRGDVGWIPRGLKGDTFDAAVFAAAPGAIIGPIDTPEGYWVLRVDDAARDKLIEQAAFKELQSGSVRRWLDQQRKDNPNAVQLFWDSDKYAWANDQIRK